MAELDIMDHVTIMEGTASDMMHQLHAENPENEMLTYDSLLGHAIGAKGLLRPRGCQACALPIATSLEGPPHAAYACSAAPWGTGRSRAVWGTVGKLPSDASVAMRELLVVRVMKWEG